MLMPPSQLALQRILDYLHLAGLHITPEVERRALQLVLAGMDSAPQDLLAESMRRLPDCFELPQFDALPQAPVIHRGSLGYGAY